MIDVELDVWRAEWQASSPALPDLGARVERETQRMRRVIVAECAVTSVFGGGSLAWAWLTRRTDVLILAGGIWVFIALAWTISFLMRRHAWAPATMSTTAFLDLSILRWQRQLKSIAAQCLLYVLIVAFNLTWIYLASPARAADGVLRFLTGIDVAWVWAVTVILAVGAARRKQRLSAELDRLIQLRAFMSDDAEPVLGGREWNRWNDRMRTRLTRNRRRRPFVGR
jgi:hypothetical protein